MGPTKYCVTTDYLLLSEKYLQIRNIEVRWILDYQISLDVFLFITMSEITVSPIIATITLLPDIESPTLNLEGPKNNLLRYTECIKRVLPTEKRPDRQGITCEREGMMARLKWRGERETRLPAIGNRFKSKNFNHCLAIRLLAFVIH